MCVYAGVLMSVMIPWCPKSWSGDASWFSYIHGHCQTILPYFLLNAPKQTAASGAIWRISTAPERHAQACENYNFHRSTGGRPLSEICLPAGRIFSALMIHLLQ